MHSEDLFLSVVVPAYNEEKRIGTSCTAILEYLGMQSYSYEILVVDDGSVDHTAQVVQDKFRGRDNAWVIAYQPNRGKGYAVRQGMLHSKGKVVLFTDADLSTPMSAIDVALGHLRGGYDVVIGSRAIPGSEIAQYQPPYRRIGARIFNLLRDATVGTNISRFKDTQCGFKVFDGSVARRLFSSLTVDGFMFDVELLYLASKLGYRICEMPVQWKDVPGSKLRLVRDTMRMFRDLSVIRWRHHDIERGSAVES